ncbi:hypothetical protein GZ212_14580 [Mangrovimonas sp. CR14]|uniref:hypothetical protein n=1 Tax=Mangrovimonas sp. CR14 TaxID=2706120 RepID=UPI00141EB2A0|nr:hypothetical protein [Mangrovimonas sp. CR14]NIK93386.1 hypothetical protein [Mangrovimonas sp. CR14]
MKKLLFITILSLLGYTSTQAQVFKLGANVGIPLGDASDVSNFAVGADFYVYFLEADSFFNIGANVGYRNFFRKDSEDDYTFQSSDFHFDNISYLPVTAAARFTLASTFYAGADVGYAFGLSDNTDGGFFAKPVIGIDIANVIEVFLAYDMYTAEYKLSEVHGLDYKFSSLNAGVLIEF